MLNVSIVFILLTVFANYALAKSDAESNRNIIYSKIMKKQKPYSQCTIDASNTYGVPEWIVMAVMKHEDGPVNGFLKWKLKRKKKNGDPIYTYDYGLTCINTIRITDLNEMGVKVTAEDIMKSPCLAINLTAFILKLEKDKLGVNGDWLTASANYHYNVKGENPKLHYIYKQKIVKVLNRFKRAINHQV